MNKIISPSLLSANFTNLLRDIKTVENLGVERLHLDVMDGHFVPNLTFGPFIINQIKEVTNLHLETHLMIESPHKYIEDYAKAGSDTIIIHQEASLNIKEDLEKIKKLGKNAGVALNPDTSHQTIEPFIDILDYILIMSVFPGFGGQSFIESTIDTMNFLKKKTDKHNIIIGVDGGVNISTIDKLINSGPNNKEENILFNNPKILNFYSKFKSIVFKNIKDKSFAIAVSGGSDSLCLAYFAKLYSYEFGNKIHVLVVDHNLRKESHKESLKVRSILKKRKIPSKILNWKGKVPKSNIQKKQEI